MKKFLAWIRGTFTFVGALVLFVILCLSSVCGYVLYYVYLDRSNLPDIEPFIKFEPPTTGEIYDLNGDVVIGLAKEYRHIVKYQDLPPVMIKAILSAEDKRFFSHRGVDRLAIGQAAVYSFVDSMAATLKTWDKGNFAVKIIYSHGGSTLDQQLAKLYFQKERTDSLGKKLEKIRLAVWMNEEMEKRYGSKAKQEIMARFASFVYIGAGRYGFDAGTEYFFNKRVKDMKPEDISQAAFIAGLVRHPFPSRSADMKKYTNRRNEVLGLMLKNGYISEKEFSELSKQEVTLTKRTSKTIAPSAVGGILEELNRDGFEDNEIFNGKIFVRSTIDLRIQKIANDALENGLKLYEQRYPEAKGIIQGAVVVLRNGDGSIAAEVGGRQVYLSRELNYPDFNRVRDAQRQPGSAFKPVVYLNAFQKGLKLNDIVLDIPIRIAMGNGKAPHVVENYDGEYKGPIRARKALAESRNAAAIWVAYRNGGIQEVIKTAKMLGIESELDPYITTTIGASVVNLMELANAFRTIASGLKTKPYIIGSVSDRSENKVFENEEKIEDLPIDPLVLQEIQEGLRGVMRLPSGTGHSLDNTVRHRSPQEEFPIPVMGKTGTTNDFRDALFVGSTYGLGGITIAVRIGFDDYRELGSKETGGRVALPVFREMMLKIYGEEEIIGPPPQFPEIIEKNINEYLAGLN